MQRRKENAVNEEETTRGNYRPSKNDLFQNERVTKVLKQKTKKEVERPPSSSERNV